MRLRLTVLVLIVALLGLAVAPLADVAAKGSPRYANLTGSVLQADDGFTDVPADHPNAQAINWLAERGIVKGYGDGRFGPDDNIVRGQVAGLITRGVGWQFQQFPNPFPDQGQLDPDLWGNVGTLNHYGVAQGFQDGTFHPTDNVVAAQMISFIARAMVAKGYWQQQPDNAQLYTNVPASSGHRSDLATYRNYAGGIYGTPDDASFPAWDMPATRAWVAEVLYRALKTIPPVSVPVTGTGSFSGVFNITNFIQPTPDSIAAVGNILNDAGQVVAQGVTMPVDLAATAAANPPVSATGEPAAQATCNILNLVLGPLHLDLLGLVIDLNQVILHITGETGANALLGNLLCGILGLLNPLGTLTQLLDLLNQLAALLNQLGLGNLAATAPATVTGNMLVDSFTRSGDQLLANGTLGGQPVSAPLALSAAPGGATSQATCEILNLVLGPLDLNLLGLRVQLNQVILHITGVTGAGNLLGNLLCAIAGVLNPVSSLSQLLDLLNNVLRSL